MISIIRQLDFSYFMSIPYGSRKNSFNSFEFYRFRRISSTLSVIASLKSTVIPLKITLTISLGSSPCTTHIVLDYLQDLLNSVIGKNCNLFRNISKSFPELSNFITQSINVESHRPFRYAKSAFEIFSLFSIFDRYSFPFSILYSAVYFFPSILVLPSTSGNLVNIRMYLDIIENISKTGERRNWKGIEKARENTHKRILLNQ